jgi:predicted nucleic acid-binding protein
VGNYVWKRRSSLSYEKSKNLLEKLLELINLMNILHVDFLEALSIAVEENITFYDSSYIQAAIQNNLELVTDDLKLYNVARKYVEVLRSQDIR